MQTELNKILDWLNDYKTATGCDGVVLGISGGKDSTTVAMLAKKVWGDNVFGVLMPNGEQSDIADSIDIVNTLGIKHGIVNIKNAYDGLISAVEIGTTPVDSSACACPKITDKAKTNIPPRLRMTVLYAIAQSLGYRVIGTGNASEAYIGWTTKWGDSAYDFNPIAHLTCSEVMAIGGILADEFGLDKKYVFKTPSDGLCGKTDEDSFGFSYAVLDGYVKGTATPDPETVNKIEQMHRASEHKRKLPASMDRPQ